MPLDAVRYRFGDVAVWKAVRMPESNDSQRKSRRYPSLHEPKSKSYSPAFGIDWVLMKTGTRVRLNIISFQVTVKEVFSSAMALSNWHQILELSILRRQFGRASRSLALGQSPKVIPTCLYGLQVRCPGCFARSFPISFAYDRFYTIMIRVIRLQKLR